MVSFKNILLTTDLSDAANVATPYAVELARRDGGQIQLVHVFEDLVLYSVPIAEPPVSIDMTEFIKGTQADRAAKLGAVAEALTKSSGLTVVPILLSGHPVHEITEFAKNQNIDCIVIATHGRTGFPHVLFGSVTERIVRSSPCPVLTVRPK